MCIGWFPGNASANATNDALVEIFVVPSTWGPEEGWPPVAYKKTYGISHSIRAYELTSKANTTVMQGGQEVPALTVGGIAAMYGYPREEVTSVTVTNELHQHVVSLTKEEAFGETPAGNPYITEEGPANSSEMWFALPAGATNSGRVKSELNRPLVVVIAMEGEGLLELAAVTTSPAQPNAGTPVTFSQPQISGRAVPGYSKVYNWVFGDGETSDLPSPTHEFEPEPGTGVTDYDVIVELALKKSGGGEVASSGAELVVVAVKDPAPPPEKHEAPPPEEKHVEPPPEEEHEAPAEAKEPVEEPKKPPPALPRFTLELEQQIQGESAYTKAELRLNVGEVIDYQATVENTGTTELILSPLQASGCEDINPIASFTLGAGGRETYTCEEMFTAPGTYTNVASIVNRAEEPQQSNEVVVEVRAPPPPSIEVPGGEGGTPGPGPRGVEGHGGSGPSVPGAHHPKGRTGNQSPPSLNSEAGGSALGGTGAGTGTGSGNGTSTGGRAVNGSNQGGSSGLPRTHEQRTLAPPSSPRGLVGVLLNSVESVLPAAASLAGGSPAAVVLQQVKHGLPGIANVSALNVVVGIAAVLLALLLGAAGEQRKRRSRR